MQNRYQFEGLMTVCETVKIEADSYEEALEEARQYFEDELYPVSQGYSIPWDNVDVNLIDSFEFEDDEDDD